MCRNSAGKKSCFQDNRTEKENYKTAKLYYLKTDMKGILWESGIYGTREK